MAQETVLGNVITFLDKIGIYDVVLPFLLVFTIVFAMLEKTKIFGTEVVRGTEFPRKNLNAMVSFVIGFLVIASSRLVEAITDISANVVVLLMASVFFLLLVGSFFKPDEAVALEKGWKTTFMIIMFVGLLAIFLNAIKTEAGKSWLKVSLDFLRDYWNDAAVASLILIIGIWIFITWVTKSEKSGSETEGK